MCVLLVRGFVGCLVDSLLGFCLSMNVCARVESTLTKDKEARCGSGSRKNCLSCRFGLSSVARSLLTLLLWLLCACLFLVGLLAFRAFLLLPSVPRPSCVLLDALVLFVAGCLGQALVRVFFGTAAPCRGLVRLCVSQRNLILVVPGCSFRDTVHVNAKRLVE